MHFTLQQLKLLEAVVRNGSFTRAAKEQHLTQPAVSIQIKRLEEQVASPLFDQVGKKIFPTAACDILYQASLDILQRVDALKTDLEILQGSVRGPLRVSVVTTAKYFMPHLLGSFLQQYPDVEPKLVFSNRERVMERLRSNKDDFVIMGQVPDDEALESFPFLNNILCVTAPPRHPLVHSKNISLKQLTHQRLLEREPGSGTRLAFDKLLAQHDLSIEPYMELGSSEAIKQGVMAGLGLAILSLHSIRVELESGRLDVLDVENFPLKRRWFAVHMKGKRLSLVAQTFLDYILAQGHLLLDDTMVLPATAAENTA